MPTVEQPFDRPSPPGLASFPAARAAPCCGLSSLEGEEVGRLGLALIQKKDLRWGGNLEEVFDDLGQTFGLIVMDIVPGFLDHDDIGQGLKRGQAFFVAKRFAAQRVDAAGALLGVIERGTPDSVK